MQAKIVLGAGFGDEGKGITTDFLCSKAKKPIVIRFSGGQQAGHTVIKNGIKHICSNFGSGVLRDVPTYFTEHTTFYPVTIMRERQELLSKNIEPTLILHPLAKLTTPYDVFANRSCEKTLSHGTCGLGVGKTMERSFSPYKLHALDLMDYNILKMKMDIISKEYYKNEGELTEEQEAEIKDFEEAVKTQKWNIANYSFLLKYHTLIFEGSQGILLDMYHGIFPHVTYSNTTSKNIHRILELLEIGDVESYYVTRAYHTRHGAGPFEETPLKLINNEEEINVNNKYQKEFKVGNMNYDLLNRAIIIDQSYYLVKTCITLVVTCMDQVPEGTFQFDKLGFEPCRIYTSHSPDSKDFKILI